MDDTTFYDFDSILSEVHDENIDSFLADITLKCLDEIKDNVKYYNIDQVISGLISILNTEIKNRNIEKFGNSKSGWSRIKTLPNFIIAKLIIAIEPIKRLAWIENADTTVLALYKNEGIDYGLYSFNEEDIQSMIFKYKPSAKMTDCKEICSYIKSDLPISYVCTDKNLIPVNNGIFDYSTKTLLDFNPDYVFTYKIRTNYNSTAVKAPVINSWNVDDWILEVANNDSDIDLLLWQIIGAVCRRNERWDKAIMLYSTIGCNGKGTLCQLMKNLLGKGSFACIEISEFNDRFALSELLKVACVICDENSTTAFSEKSSKFKSIVTGDEISLERKHQDRITVKFNGLIVECLNALPAIGDKSSSLSRRLLFVPFEKSFKDCDNKDIKSDYINRKEVLEYVLNKVLNMDYTRFSIPDKCNDVLDEYNVLNDNVRQFASEFLDVLVWDLVPYSFLYDLYKAWLLECNPCAHPLGKKLFISRFKELINTEYDDKWKAHDDPVTANQNGNMKNPETLIAKYYLRKWMNPTYTGKDDKKISTPRISSSYRGMVRK